MRYTALFMIILGIVIACFAGVYYANGDADRTENLFVLGVVLPLVVAVALMTTGTGLWVIGGRGYTIWGSAPGRDPTRGSGPGLTHLEVVTR